MEVRLLQIEEVSKRVGFSKSQIYRLIAAGQFPAPLKVSARAVRWRSDEIDEYVMGDHPRGAKG